MTVTFRAINNSLLEFCMMVTLLTTEEALLLMTPVGEEVDKKTSGNARPSVNAATMSFYLR